MRDVPIGLRAPLYKKGYFEHFHKAGHPFKQDIPLRIGRDFLLLLGGMMKYYRIDLSATRFK